MRKKQSRLAEHRKIRFKAARNQFKHLVLRGLHIPNKPQTVSLLGELAKMDNLISERTWQSWFATRAPLPQPSTIDCLDRYLALLIQRNQVECAERIFRDIQDGYFREMVHGGLLSQMLAPTEASDAVQMLRRRAMEYQPMTSLHLHFDAMDAAAWCEDFCGVSWSIVATIAADRILQLLDERWSPRSGYVYAGFSSDLSLAWAASDEQKRSDIKRMFKKMKPDLFELGMQPGAFPQWHRLGVAKDISYRHVYKLLFALAGDPDFLVEDRLQTWSFDLATSALAMHALAWTDRFNTMALGMPPELQYWAAFHEIFFNPNLADIDHWSISSVMESWPADWSERSAAVLADARKTYTTLLHDLGLEPGDVCAGLLNTRAERPLIFN